MNRIDRKKALRQQQSEINDHTLYTKLALLDPDQHNQKIFTHIAKEEKEHYLFWKEITAKEITPQGWVIWWYLLLARVLGISFAVKSIESREVGSEAFYKSLIPIYPKASIIYEQEKDHEQSLIHMLNDTKLNYAGAIVLGMNDALVELTGTLSGIALAFDKSLIVGITGFIMGIAASLSMAGSAYLESKENPTKDTPALTYAAYTGVSYILTTIILVAPFFIFEMTHTALIWMFSAALLSILGYNYYISVAKELDFMKRVKEMSAITFGVALISFAIGYGVKYFFGIEI